MGVISILLGIIAFIAFTGAGAILGNTIVQYKTILATSLLALNDISNTSLMIGVIGVFGFIGLLIGINLIVTGLNYSKVSKLYRRLRHKN